MQSHWWLSIWWRRTILLHYVIFHFLTIRHVCSIFSSAGKFFLAYMLRQLTHDVKIDVGILIWSHLWPTMKKANDVRRKPLCDVECQKWKKWRVINNIFNGIGLKNNQTSVSDSDWNPNPRVNGQCRKRGKPRFRHCPFAPGLGFQLRINAISTFRRWINFDCVVLI